VRLPNARRSSATIAVPVMQDGGILAALCLTTFGRMMTPAMIKLHLPGLRETAEAMAAAYASRSAAD